MCSRADEPTQHDVPAVLPMPVDPLIAAVNTPGAHYIDGDGEEWVVGEYGNDYPADPIRCRYDDCPEGHPTVPDEDDGVNTQQVTCPTCRADLDLPTLEDKR